MKRGGRPPCLLIFMVQTSRRGSLALHRPNTDDKKKGDTPRCAVCPKAQDPFSFKWEPPAQRLPSDLLPGIFHDGFSSRNIFKAKSSY